MEVHSTYKFGRFNKSQKIRIFTLTLNCSKLLKMVSISNTKHRAIALNVEENQTEFFLTLT